MPCREILNKFKIVINMVKKKKNEAKPSQVNETKRNTENIYKWQYKQKQRQNNNIQITVNLSLLNVINTKKTWITRRDDVHQSLSLNCDNEMKKQQTKDNKKKTITSILLSK